MQPKDFEEELANSSEKVQRRRKRFEKSKRTCPEMLDPAQQLKHDKFFVAETQPMSPVGNFFLVLANLTITSVKLLHI